MTARIVQFPRRDRSTVRVEYAEDRWRVIYSDQGWPCLSRAAALREAIAIADQTCATVIVRPRGRERGHT
jgi:hypothetical protein